MLMFTHKTPLLRDVAWLLFQFIYLDDVLPYDLLCERYDPAS